MPPIQPSTVLSSSTAIRLMRSATKDSRTSSKADSRSGQASGQLTAKLSTNIAATCWIADSLVETRSTMRIPDLLVHLVFFIHTATASHLPWPMCHQSTVCTCMSHLFYCASPSLAAELFRTRRGVPQKAHSLYQPRILAHPHRFISRSLVTMLESTFS